jgi:chaperonin cofactor prefoldin
MDLFNRKRAFEPEPEPVEAWSAAPAPTSSPTLVAVASPAPLVSGLRVASVEVPEANPASAPAPEDAAVQEVDEAAAEDMRNLPLGTLLHRHGLVQEEQLVEALGAGKESGDRLGEILIRRGLVSEEEIQRMLALQQGLPFLLADDIEFDAAAASLLSPEDARQLAALPVRVDGDVVLVVSPSPSDEQRDELERRLHLRVESAVVSQTTFEQLLTREEPLEAPDEAASDQSEWVDEAAVEQVDAPVEDALPEGPFWAAPSSGPVGDEPQSEPAISWKPFEFSSPEDAPTDGAAVEDTPAPTSWSEDEPVAGEPDSWSTPGAETFEESSQSEEPQTVYESQFEESTAIAESAVEETAPVEPSESWQEATVPAEAEWSEQDAGESGWAGAGEPAVEAEAHDTVSHVAVEDGRIGELGAQHEESVGRIQQLLGQIEAGASTFTDLRHRLGELGDSLRVAEGSLAEREQRLGELGQAHDEDQRRIDELVGQLREREEVLGELGGRVEDLSGRLVTAEERLDERERRLTELDASLTEGAARVEELFRQVELRDQALTSFADKLGELAGRFAAAE